MHIVVVPAFNELTVGDAVYPDSRPSDLFSGGLDALELALVSSSKCETGDDFVSRLDDVINSNVDVGEGYLTGDNAPLDGLGANLVAVWPDADVVRCAYLINDFQPSSVPGFLVHPPNEVGAIFSQCRFLIRPGLPQAFQLGCLAGYAGIVIRSEAFYTLVDGLWVQVSLGDDVGLGPTGQPFVVPV